MLHDLVVDGFAGDIDSGGHAHPCAGRGQSVGEQRMPAGAGYGDSGSDHLFVAVRNGERTVLVGDLFPVFAQVADDLMLVSRRTQQKRGRSLPPLRKPPSRTRHGAHAASSGHVERSFVHGSDTVSLGDDECVRRDLRDANNRQSKT